MFIYPRLRQQPATALDARSSNQGGFQNPSSWAPNSTNLGSKIKKNPSSWAPKSTKLVSKIKKNQSWEDSGGVLGPSWPQEPPKTKIYPQNKFLGALLGTHFGGQKPFKINFLGFQEVLIF